MRDSTAGVGTLTYVDPQTGAYGALGHAIVDADTGKLLDAREGAILRANIVGVAKGQSGKAGELKGNFLGGAADRQPAGELRIRHLRRDGTRPARSTRKG